jgi:hypothetical protein
MKKLLLLIVFFVLSFAQYNPQLSKDLCQLTITSYCVPISVLNWNCGPCKTSMLQIKNVSLFLNSSQNTAGYIAVSNSLQSVSKFPFLLSPGFQRNITLVIEKLDF